MEKKKKKKIGRVILIIFAVIILVAAAVCFWQRENIKALLIFAKTDAESSAELLTENKDSLETELLEDYGLELAPPSIEQSDALIWGEMSLEEYAETLPHSSESEDTASSEGDETPADPADIVSECVTALYTCEANLMVTLGQMKNELIDEWLALPEEERTEEKKREMGMDGLHECYGLETVVDAEVEAILDTYRAKMKAVGGDLSVFDDLWEYYLNEKANTKAYYMNKYM